jgi:hypothetical protein
MALAAGLYRLLPALRAAGCAKLVHGLGVRCIHCGYEPGPASRALSKAGGPVHEL